MAAKVAVFIDIIGGFGFFYSQKNMINPTPNKKNLFFRFVTKMVLFLQYYFCHQITSKNG
jgi:hypothetical protein